MPRYGSDRGGRHGLRSRVARPGTRTGSPTPAGGPTGPSASQIWKRASPSGAGCGGSMRMRNTVLALAAAAALIAAGCGPRRADWGLDAIRTMQTPPDPPARLRASTSPPTPRRGARATCAFAAGAHASTTLGIDAADASRGHPHPPRHHRDEGEPELRPPPRQPPRPRPARRGAGPADLHEPGPARATRSPRSTRPRPASPLDPDHQSASVLACIDGGTMDGFVRNAAQHHRHRRALRDGATTTHADLPFYYWLASTFALGDRHFAPMASGTFAQPQLPPLRHQRRRRRHRASPSRRRARPRSSSSS